MSPACPPYPCIRVLSLPASLQSATTTAAGALAREKMFFTKKINSARFSQTIQALTAKNTVRQFFTLKSSWCKTCSQKSISHRAEDTSLFSAQGDAQVRPQGTTTTVVLRSGVPVARRRIDRTLWTPCILRCFSTTHSGQVRKRQNLKSTASGIRYKIFWITLDREAKLD